MKVLFYYSSLPLSIYVEIQCRNSSYEGVLPVCSIKKSLRCVVASVFHITFLVLVHRSWHLQRAGRHSNLYLESIAPNSLENEEFDKGTTVQSCLFLQNDI